MAGKGTAVFGIYHTGKQAERSGDDLKAAGFSIDDVSVLLPDAPGSKSFAHEKNTKAPEGATTGVTAGGAIGAVIGLLTGMGILAIPGAGPFVAAGPIMCTLAGLGAGGALGGLIGALVGMSIPEYEAKRFKGQIKDGGILLSVHCDTSDEIVRAKDLLKQTGARDIASTAEANADYAADSTVAAQK
ncbi:MAG TPA: hypothetical protein VK789_11985 [Bryobacteraceae bacterium]|jgi:hypothetical protein|nr:hypothetical protein [Bryobacteraceae bacterium]